MTSPTVYPSFQVVICHVFVSAQYPRLSLQDNEGHLPEKNERKQSKR